MIIIIALPECKKKRQQQQEQIHNKKKIIFIIENFFIVDNKTIGKKYIEINYYYISL
jgi:hypothetical protein